MKIYPFKPTLPLMDLVPSPDSFFSSIKSQYLNHKAAGFFEEHDHPLIFVHQIQSPLGTFGGIIAANDISDLREWMNLCGQAWEEESIYAFVKSDVSKLDFIPCFTSDTFTDEMLNNIIETESTFIHAAGSFFSIDLETVNNWLITELLQRKTDSTFVRKYALK